MTDSKRTITTSIKLLNGKEMPAFGLGTWRSPTGAVTLAVKEALLTGYRHLDCAWVYGNQDEVGAGIRAALEENKELKRSDIFVTTKLWCTSHNPEYVEVECKESLKQLGLDYVDLYLIHWPVAMQRIMKDDGSVSVMPVGADGKRLIDTAQDINKTWTAMEALVTKGLVKSIGVSNFSNEQVDALLKTAKIKPVCNQVEVHGFFPQQELINHHKEVGVAVTAYSPLGMVGGDIKQSPLSNETVKAIADKYSKTPAQVLIRWALERGLCVIPKTTSKTRLAENSAVFDFALTADEVTALEELTVKDPALRARQCNPPFTPDGTSHFKD